MPKIKSTLRAWGFLTLLLLTHIILVACADTKHHEALGQASRNSEDDFVAASKHLISRFGDRLRAHIRNGSVQWHMEHDNILACVFVQVFNNSVWVTWDGTNDPHYSWDMLRVEVVLNLLQDYLHLGHRGRRGHNRTTSSDFSFFYCAGDCPKTALDGRVRLALTSVVCDQSVSLPALQHLAAKSRDPDWDRWQSYMDGMQQTYGNTGSTWDQRQSKAVFRGNLKHMSIACDGAECNSHVPYMMPSDYIFITPDIWQKYGRYKLLYLRSQRPDLLNIAAPEYEYPYHQRWNYTFNTTAFPIDEPRSMSLEDQIKQFKYAVYAEGNCGWADRLKLLFLHGFLVFLQDTSCAEYYRFFFRPWVHYVPVDGKFNNLTAGIEWAQQHDAEAKAIAIRGQEHAFRVLNRHHVQRFMFDVFDEVRSLNDMMSAGRPTAPLPGAARYNQSMLLTAVPLEERIKYLYNYVQYKEEAGWWVAVDPPK